MQKWLREIVAQAARAPPMQPPQAVKQAVLERMIILWARTILHQPHAESAIFKKPLESLRSVMTKMMRQRQPEPVFAEMARLIAAKIRQPNESDAARAQKPPGFLQDGAGVGQMLERIPESDHIEFA